jgi:hypothetical protein
VGPGPSWLTFQIPGGLDGTVTPGTVQVVLLNPDKSKSPPMTLTIEQTRAPTVTGISALNPCIAGGPTRWSIHGSEFSFDAQLRINGRPVQVLDITRTKMTVLARRADLFQGGNPASIEVTIPAPGGGESSGQFTEDSSGVECDRE